MKTIGLNIETAADSDKLDLLGSIEVAYGNTKDPEKRRAKEEEVKQKALERLALEPFASKLLCATLVVRKEPTDEHPDGALKFATVHTAASSEKEVLLWLWRLVDKPETRLVTFNGTGFDIPYLIARSLVNDVPFPSIERNKYRTCELGSTHVDMYQFLSSLGSNPLGLTQNLSFYAKEILGLEFPFKELDQSKLNEIGRDTVQKLCEWNASTALLLFERASRQKAVPQ